MRRYPNAFCCLLIVPLLYSAQESSWQNEQGYRWMQLKRNVSGGSNGFTRIENESSGITFTNHLPVSRYWTNQNLLNGSGVAAGDIDGDGAPELLFCGLDSPNALYRHLGNWSFTNIARSVGIEMRGLSCTGAAFADLDGDGDLDLAVNTFGQGTRVFENRGGAFVQRAELNPLRAGMSLAIADIDGDTDLDIYITNYRVETVRDDPLAVFDGDFVKNRRVLKSYNKRPLNEGELLGRFYMTVDGRIVENGEADRLYRNDGDWKFSEAGFDSGAFLDENGQKLPTIPRDWGLSCMFRDMNRDGAPDLYVCNDFESPDRIWINNGRGVFRPIERLSVRHTSKFSMGIDFADVNRDGFDDFFICEMLSRTHEERNTRAGTIPNIHRVGEYTDRPQYVQNTLQINRGDETYSDRAYLSGVEASDWSWAAAFLDVDLDGFEDLLITTGNELDSLDHDLIEEAEQIKKQRHLDRNGILALRLKVFKPLRTPNMAYRNTGNGRFVDASAEWRFNESSVSQGMCLADIDQDGDLDVAINNLNSPASVYRNEAIGGRVAVKLNGLAGNTRGLGAKVSLRGSPVAQSQEMMAGGRYLSSDEPVRVFAFGTNSSGRIEVSWRSGKRSAIEGVRAGRLYEISEPQDGTIEPKTAPATPWFEDASELLNHKHVDLQDGDFDRQPMLPYRLSQLGPDAKWADYDGDGWSDLILSTGRGGTLAVYRNNREGGFARLNEPYLQRQAARDQTSLAVLGQTVLANNSSWEDGLTNRGALRVYHLEQKASGESLAGFEGCSGPLALGDCDGDGIPELFVGGLALPARFPELASSILYRMESGRYVPKQRFEQLGLVTAAVFSDLDADGDLDLALACHWGPLRVLHNEAGKLQDRTQELGLGELTGLWSRIAAADVNGDGLPDLIASNWGENTPWRASPESPLKLYYGDFDQNGVFDVLEARFDAQAAREVPLRSLRTVGTALPRLLEQYKTYRAYGRASVQHLVGESRHLSVTTLKATVFLNRRALFDPLPLPLEAQVAPSFGISAGDINGDGKLDLFLAQNFFQGHSELPRADAGIGVLLIGDGTGQFKAVPPGESGIRVFGEGRACAFNDFDRDGDLDLVVTQNGAETKLYRNRFLRP